MIILTNDNNPNALKLIIGLKLAQQSVEINTVSCRDAVLGYLPSLQLPSGSSLFSTSAALQFLIPTPEESSVLINKWLEWDISQLQPALVSYGGSGKLDTSHKPRIWSLLKELNRCLKSKERLIETNTVLSVADVSIWVSLWSTIAAVEVSKELTKEFPHVQEWLNNLESLPVVQESLKEFKFERGMNAIGSIQAASWFPLNSYTGGTLNKQLSNEVNTPKEKEVASISEEEILNVKKNWTSKDYPNLKEPSYPVLPKKGEKNILITSALPYVNNVPHLGNIIGCVLSGDIFARYCRQRNYNTLYISGTDEYGTATEAKAVEENMTPQQICDKFFSIHNDIYRWFSIGFDYFGRTTTPEQTEIVQSLFLRLKDKGFINMETIDQLLCEKCDRFLADRFVEGTCPGCKYEDARGDQCDGCGHLVNATELLNPRCKVCNNSPVIKPSVQFFLDLPKIEPILKKWAAKTEGEWSPTARVVAKPWLRDGLKPRCITRDLKWGIPVPIEEYKKKVFYVWFDAPVGYISITKRYTKDYEQWWKPKDHDVSLYQFMAKDNVPFHAIMFPASLLAADNGHTLVNHIMAIEYLNYEDTKFSKSRGIGVFGTDARDTGIPADVWRFYLAYIRPESQDSNFNWVDLATKNNSELLNNLGNFVNRALTFAEKNFGSKVPPMELREDDLIVLALAQRELSQYVAALEKAKMRDALRHILAISKHGNQYMQSQEPWVKIKGSDDDKKKAGTVIGVCSNLACLLSALLGPYMPSTSRELRAQLGLDKISYGYIPDTIMTFLPAGHKIGKPSPLFSKIEDQQVELLRKKYAGKQDSPSRELKSVIPAAATDAAALEAAIVKQGLLVRDLKAKGDKTIWQPQVQILLQLKKQLAELTSSTTKINSQSTPVNAKKSVSAATSELNGGGGQDVATLEAAIAKQGLLVRDLKTKGDKSVWQPEVEILLNLKKQLASITGAPVSAANDKKSKKKK
ncbi:methionine--tRNA ligase, cytoplasmic isoform X1 [Neodiprion virginianus]|uniref:methionine--tRNA ligase, cytoplasmic isoform X1 n=1 Tax=Neodiprion virginianus TaxID=2961670 RepID=UPI001EE75E3F|nr:methionine--tRNA ligase, cytoplasmic isoform X1 [Neodiprion virginianus]